MNPCAEWTTKALHDYVGGLSKPSKMPGWAYSLPALECKTGTRLRAVQGSTCSGCYAMKGNYTRYPAVGRAMYRRLDAISAEHWVPAMAELIARKTAKDAEPVFRWHDSGDLQTVQHLERIAQVCELTPHVRHWLPTREYQIVQAYIAEHKRFPENLNVRLSAHMIGGVTPTFPRLRGLVTVSTVSTDGNQGAHQCPAPAQGNVCGDCRACWDRAVPVVDYHLH